MPESSIIGTRIRENRLLRGLRQSELAKAVGISPSYLNLIEHNRRRIGGKILLEIAATLNVEPSVLSQGAEAALIAGLQEAARRDVEGNSAEQDRLEEFAGRFPGWAKLLVDLHRRSEELEHSVKALTDRLAHDPHLAESIHEVLSVVTAIRSTASILVDPKPLEPEWQNRFHRNINEDSRRLAEGAKALAQYLDAAPGSESDIRSPQDELDTFLSENRYHFTPLEIGGGATVDDILDVDQFLTLPAAIEMARTVLKQYEADAHRVHYGELLAEIEKRGVAPIELADAMNVNPATIFRRLATLPEEHVGPIGLAICDGSGTLLLRKPFDGFLVTRMSGSCPLWPLYRVLAQPDVPLQMRLQQVGRDARPVTAMAVAERVGPMQFNVPPTLRAYMLVVPMSVTDEAECLVEVGTSCRVCSREGCLSRREPSAMQSGF